MKASKYVARTFLAGALLLLLQAPSHARDRCPGDERCSDSARESDYQVLKPRPYLSGTTQYDSLNSPRVYDEQGTYRGRLNQNRYDPESISNPYGQYGSPLSPDSLRNPYGTVPSTITIERQ